MRMKHCKCKKPTSSVDGKCVVCGGDMNKKWKKARRDFEKYVEGKLKEPCDLCGSKLDCVMCNYVTAFYCTNVKCKRNKIPPGTFGSPAAISTSTTLLKREKL